MYLNGLLLLKNRCKVRQDEATVLLFSAFFSDQQHIGQHKGNHVQVDKLRGQCRQDAVNHHSLSDKGKSKLQEEISKNKNLKHSWWIVR